MVAEVQKRNPRRYLAWCEACQDGYQGGKATAAKWAANHNAARHDSELP